MALVGADDGIAFPMAELASSLDDSGSFTDMTFPDDSSAGFWASTPFSSELGDDAKVSPELAATLSVEADIAIDGLGAHGMLAEYARAADNLSGAPLGLNVSGDGRPVLMCVLKITTRAVSPGDGVLLGLRRSIGAVVGGCVTLEFANDGGGMSVEDASDRAL